MARGEHYAVQGRRRNFTLSWRCFSAQDAPVIALPKRHFIGICWLILGAVSSCGKASVVAPSSPMQAAGAGNGATEGAAGSVNASGANGALASASSALVYVGSSNGQIFLYTLNSATGQLTLVKGFAAGNYPSFVAFDPSYTHAYAVNEADSMVASFAIDQKNGDLTFLNRVASGGDGPAFVGVDHSGKYVLVANYGGGTTRLFPILAGGALGPASDGKSPGIKSHMILTDPANRFAFVMNLGSDTVVQYAFDAANGKLSPNAVPAVMTAKGAGPRHMAFHPNGKFAYVIDELNQTLSAYSYDANLGRLSALQTLSTLPSGTPGDGVTCAEVVVAPSGNFVYGSNRNGGKDSIATFSVDGATGKLTFLGTTPSGGSVPRSFTLSVDGKLMLVANESGNVTSFAVDVESGSLSKLSSIDVPPKPQFVGIVALPNYGISAP